MKKTDLLLGVLIGIAACFLGTFIFIKAFTDYGFMEGVNAMRAQDSFGKLVTIGAILNLIVFFVLLKFNKDLMARGVILSLILLAIFTLVV
jgi:hypothetical protein